MLVKSFVENLMLMLGGIALFLFGLKMMSDNMQSLAGNKMRKLLSTATSSGIRGVLAGATVTAVIQSSTATNIMLVGFVNAGILQLSRAVPVIMGANIGTTVTAQLVSLSGSNLFNITAIGSLLAFVGFLMTLAEKETVSKTGGIIFGFGSIFIGLNIMNASIYTFRSYEFFRRLFMADNPLLLVLNGFLITGIVQSSSAVSSVMIILAVNGLISFENSMYLILGTNIGAGVAVLFVSSTMSKDARNVAVANILFNVFGTILCIIPIIAFEKQIAAFFAQISGGIERQVANFHTVFNVLVTFVLLPLIKPFTLIIEKLGNLKFPSLHLKRRKALKSNR